MSDPQTPPAAPFRALIIAPDPRPPIVGLARRCPLVLTPFLGKTVLEHAVTAMASRGANAITILASDRAGELGAVVGNGEAWGIKIEVVSVARELTTEEALVSHGQSDAGALLLPAREAWLLDRLPTLPDYPLWESYGGWFSALCAFLGKAARERVGMRELEPGVFAGMRARIADTARITGPCWIGANVFIGPHAVIGPQAIIEDNSYVEESAQVTASVIGPGTYLGALTEVVNSFAWGKYLLNLPSGSLTEITDRFLLDDLSSAPRGDSRRPDAAAPAVEALSPAGILERARAIAPGLWRKWSRRGGDSSQP